METAAMIELAKLGLQIFFALSAAADLTEEEKVSLLNEERARFKKNIAQPLPDV